MSTPLFLSPRKPLAKFFTFDLFLLYKRVNLKKITGVSEERLDDVYR